MLLILLQMKKWHNYQSSWIGHYTHTTVHLAAMRFAKLSGGRRRFYLPVSYLWCDCRTPWLLLLPPLHSWWISMRCGMVTGTGADMLSHCDEKHSEMMWRECSPVHREMESWLWHLGIPPRYLCQSARLHTCGLLTGARAEDLTHFFLDQWRLRLLHCLVVASAVHVENSETWTPSNQGSGWGAGCWPAWFLALNWTETGRKCGLWLMEHF